MLNLNSLMLGSENPKKLADFYEKVLQKKPNMIDEEHGWYGFLVGKCFLSIGKHSEVKGISKEPARLIFNFESEKVQEEFERIKEIEGVSVVTKPYEIEGSWIATLADPDGNYFQLASPWKN